MDWVLGKVPDQSFCDPSAGNIEVTDLISANDFVESLEVLLMALEVLHKQAESRGLKVLRMW